MVLRAPGMLALHVALDVVEGPATVTVWDDTVPAWDMGALAAQWFSDFLGQPCRLVRFDPGHLRLSSKKWTGDLDAHTQFADGFAVLVTSEASIDDLNERLVAKGHEAVGVERFRPNVVLGGVEAHDEDRVDGFDVLDARGLRLRMAKPCTRCPIPDIDPVTAVQGTAVGDAIRAYRQDDRVDGAITFGMNAVLEGLHDGAELAVGQSVAGDWQFA